MTTKPAANANAYADAYFEGEQALMQELAAKKSAKHTRASLMKTYTTKSSAVRALTSQGFTRSEIVAFMNTDLAKDDKAMLYQHVRNIQVTIVKKK